MPTRWRSACRWAASATTTTWPARPSSWPRARATTWWARRWWWTAASRTHAAERCREQRSDLPVLRAAAGDLGRAHPVAQLGAARERPALFQPEQHRAAPRIAAAGGIDHGVGLDGRHVGLLAADPDVAALAAQRDH